MALTATNHAKMYGLHPKKGTIAVGADADIAIWDPDRKVTIRQEILHHGSDYTPYEGIEVTGWPVTTIVRGEDRRARWSPCRQPERRPARPARALTLCRTRRDPRAAGSWLGFCPLPLSGCIDPSSFSNVMPVVLCRRRASSTKTRLPPARRGVREVIG